MKVIALIAAGAVCFLGQAAAANPIKTRVANIDGTTFIVSVDWDTNAVSARLGANPAHLTGGALEQSMQNAVYYGSAVDCRMQESGRKRLGQNEIIGALHCPWFGKAPRPQS